MRARDPWVRAYAGRNWLSGQGWIFWLCLFPARRLMRRDEEGCVILAGLHVEAQFVWRSRWDRLNGHFCPRLNVWARSDAGEIAARIAAAAGAQPLIAA